MRAAARTSRATRRTQGVLGGRSEAVVARVLEAAIAELARAGVSGFHMERVAAEAQVNKTTIYRRWPTRAALLGAVVERLRAPLRERPLPDTGRLEEDLVEAFARRVEVAGRSEGRAWARLLAERHHPDVQALIGAAVDVRADEWRAMVTRAVERGELPRRTDPRLVLYFVRALVESRGLASPKDVGFLRVAVRTVLAGARAGTLVEDRAR